MSKEEQEVTPVCACKGFHTQHPVIWSSKMPQTFLPQQHPPTLSLLPEMSPFPSFTQLPPLSLKSQFQGHMN